jgi:hypothetical protein
VSTTTATVSTTAAAVESAATTTSVEGATTTAHASTVEAAAYVATAVEPTRCPTCEGVSTTCIAGSAAVKGSARAGVANSTPVTDSTTTVAVARSTVVSTAAIVAAATPIPAIPGAGPDEETTDKPARPVVAVGRACVRIIVVIPPRADRGGIPVTVITVSTAIANPDTYTYLGTRRSRHERCRNYQRAEQQEISENLHLDLRAKASCIA